MSQALDPKLSMSLDVSVSIGAAYSMLRGIFERHGLEDAQESAKILISAAVPCNRSLLLTSPERLLTESSLRLLEHFAHRRLRREPISRILGIREFWGLEIQVTPAVLDPRADTETLVDNCIEWTRATGLKRPRVLDLGTGSGAILCAVLSAIPEAEGVGIDISADACLVARSNLGSLGLSGRGAILCVDMAEFVDPSFDIVLSNPPYVQSSAIEGLDLEVCGYDPHVALDGGSDGLLFYRLILSKYNQWVREKFFCSVEIGHDQGPAVKQMLQSIGISGQVKKDLSGNDRIVSWEG